MDKRFNSAQIIAVNSIEVQKRVKSVWHLESKVIYPPVEIVDLRPSKFVKNESDGEYLVSAGRWVPYKRFDLAIDVAEKSGLSLKIMGGGPERSRLQKRIETSSTQVELIENPSNEEYVKYLKGAKALIFPGIEDFGIVPVEAMQLGVPVLGINAGGLIETVIDGTSGFLCSNLDEIVASINKVHSLSREDIIEQGNTFSSIIFRSSFEKWVEKSIPE
jgi:glycosyltransferase involved in cell wall biosynthesis